MFRTNYFVRKGEDRLSLHSTIAPHEAPWGGLGQGDVDEGGLTSGLRVGLRVGTSHRDLTFLLVDLEHGDVGICVEELGNAIESRRRLGAVKAVDYDVAHAIAFVQQRYCRGRCV